MIPYPWLTEKQMILLYDIFAMEEAFSNLHFQSFCVNSLFALNSVSFTWCEEWVIVIQTIS